MYGGADDYARTSLPLIEAAGLTASELTVAQARSRFPQIDFAGVRTAFWEEEAGYLLARRACQAVVAGFVAEGGEYRQLAVRPGPLAGEAMGPLDLSDGSALKADAYVFACGPWLGRLFPDLLGERTILPTRQEVFYFGTPAGDPRYLEESCPIWIDIADGSSFYGIPGNDHRGFKVADDTRGEPFDPTDGDRSPTPAFVERSRAFLARRFPGLAGAPLLEARVCQYENSPDGHLLFDRHPQAGNVWLLGGGSGHGFKLGPPLGQDVADVILGERQAPEAFALSRLRQVEDIPFKTQLLGRA
jgi:glycine/D-amino acid oxidase-like deaminating enzyme